MKICLLKDKVSISYKKRSKKYTNSKERKGLDIFQESHKMPGSRKSPFKDMNIFIITHRIAPDKIGGSETQTLALATEMAKKHQVTVITKWTPNLPRIEKKNQFLIKRLGKKHELPFPLFTFTFSVLSEIEREKKKIDILFAKTITNGFITVLAKKFFKIPAVVLIEGEQEYSARSPFNQFLLKTVAKRTRLLAQTHTIQRELAKRTGAKAGVIPNGVYLGQESARGESILYVGRLRRDKVNDKGVRFLIDAAIDNHLETLIIGDGPERAILEQRAGEHKNIRFLGEVPPVKINSYLQRGFVLVVPSVYGEGLPNVILEAMAVGLPVIATETAGIPDIIEHGRTGFLIAAGSSLEIEHYIRILRQDRLLWKELSENCRQTVHKYEWRAVVKKFEDFFEETLHSRLN